VAATQAELQASEEARDQAVADHLAAQRRLTAAAAELGEARDDLRRQAVAAFVRFGSGADDVGMLLKAEDVGQLEGARALAGAVTRAQADVVDRYHELEATHRGLEARAEAGRIEAEAQRQAVAELAASLVVLRDDVARARSQVAAEAVREEALLASAQERKAAHEARIASLQAESQSIAEMIRRRQAEREAQLRRAADEAAALARQADAARRTAVPVVDDLAVTPSGRGVLAVPVSASRLSSSFGMRVHPIFGSQRMHTGVDFAASTGTPIRAAADGVVIAVGGQGGYGLTVVLDHGGSLATLYAHMSAFAVGDGETVARGQVIGYVGSTGSSTGPHLHFEVRVDGTPVNPAAYL
jgi:murein DD-endopeptidase MepM/ murein hydrolase activator NlpD